MILIFEMCVLKYLCAIYLALVCSVGLAEKIAKHQKDDLVLSMGLRLPNIDPTSASGKLIHQWAKELERSQGSVSHSKAVQRERLIVQQIDSGKLSLQAYHDYQRFAAGTGNVDSAKLLLTYGIGASISMLRPSDHLHIAARNCDLSALKDLLDEAAPTFVDMPTEDGTTSLMIASFLNCSQIVSYLLSEGADVHAVGLSGTTALMVAAAKGNVQILNLLISIGEAPAITFKHKFADSTALHFAAEMNQHAAIAALCNHPALVGEHHSMHLGADSDTSREPVRNFGNSRTSIGSTALHTAAQNNASRDTVLNLVTFCLCDVDALLNGDTTALYLAAQEGHVESIRGLLVANATVDFTMPESFYKGAKHVVQLGSSKGDINAIDEMTVNTEAGNGARPIHVAAENGHADALRVLLYEGKANVNSLSIGTTALHLAVQYNRPDCVDVLLTHPNIQIDTRARTDGTTALYGAAGRGHIELVRVLLAKGASLTLTGRNGGTSILYATIRNHSRIVDALLVEAEAREQKFVIELPGNDGSRPLAAACSMGYSDIVASLLRHGASCYPLPNIVLSSNTRPADKRRTNLSHPVSCLFLAVQSGSVDTVLAVLLAVPGESVRWTNSESTHTPPPFSLENTPGDPFLEAIDSNAVEIVQLLTVYGRTPAATDLLRAILRGRASIVGKFLAQGVACNVLVGRSGTQETETLVDIAKRRRDFDTLQVLMSAERCRPDVVRGGEL